MHVIRRNGNYKSFEELCIETLWRTSDVRWARSVYSVHVTLAHLMHCLSERAKFSNIEIEYYHAKFRMCINYAATANWVLMANGYLTTCELSIHIMKSRVSR